MIPRQFVYDYQGKQEKIFSKEDREALRERLSQIKRKAISRIGGLKNQAIKNLKMNGVKVFEAKTNKKARTLLKKLVGQEKLIVKSKSNTLKEIEINKLAKQNQWDLIETDLGDFLAELVGSDSDHPVLPALELSVDEIKQALKKDLEGIEEIVKEVSSRIRQKIFQAKVGLSGANALTAEGQIVILENEGNISLISRIPKKHIVVAGIEKLVFSIEEALHVCRCATLWGTAQAWPSYINIITGPSKTADIQNRLVVGTQGAKEVDLILIDDWRSEFIGGPFEEILYCINCGACLNFCPVYLTTSKAVKVLEPKKNFRCTTCSACTLNCPAKIDWLVMILKARERHLKKKKAPRQLREMISNIRRFGNPFGKTKFDKIPKKLYCC